MWWAVAILVITTLVARATQPKLPLPEAQKGRVPHVKEGTPIKKIYGTVWIDDSMVLGFKQIGTDPIRKKGGKK